MRKELPTGLAVVIGAVAILAVLGLGYMFYQRTAGTPAEDPELARKQWEVERARTPSAPATAPGNTNPGQFSPGREGEMGARSQSGS